MRILLDLNSTLSCNFREVYDHEKFTYKVYLEKYRQWLVELLKEHEVILITARPERYRKETEARILNETGWLPDKLYFKPNGLSKVPVQNFKEMVLKELYPDGNIPDDVIALESNAVTREMYSIHGVYAVPVPKEGEWSQLPKRGEPARKQKKEPPKEFQMLMFL